jgi:hypothetical protein
LLEDLKMRLQIATPSGQREMTESEQAEFIAARPAKNQIAEAKKESGNEKIDALIDALVLNGALSSVDANAIKSGN